MPLIVVGNNHRLYAAGARRAGMPAGAVLDAGSHPSRAIKPLREAVQLSRFWKDSPQESGMPGIGLIKTAPVPLSPPSRE